MKMALFLFLLIISCSVDDDTNEHNEEYELLKQTDKLNLNLGLYRSPYMDGRIYGYAGFPGLKYLDIISGETKYLKIKWQNYNDTSLYFDYSIQIMETYVRNDSLFALGTVLAGKYIFYCYYIDLENGVATLYKGDDVSMNRVIYNTILNGSEISISEYGEAYLFDEQVKKWVNLEGFDSWCYVHSVAIISTNEMLYTCGTELRKISAENGVSGVVLIDNDSLWQSVLYKDADDNVNLIMQNKLYELRSDSLKFKAKLNKSLHSNCFNTIVKDNNIIRSGDSTIFFHDSQLLIDSRNNLNVLENNQLYDICYDFGIYVHYVDSKIYVLNHIDSTIDVVKIQNR